MSKELEDRLLVVEHSIQIHEIELTRIKSLIHDHNKIVDQMKINQKTLHDLQLSDTEYQVPVCIDCTDKFNEDECY